MGDDAMSTDAASGAAAPEINKQLELSGLVAADTFSNMTSELYKLIIPCEHHLAGGTRWFVIHFGTESREFE